MRGAFFGILVAALACPASAAAEDVIVVLQRGMDLHAYGPNLAQAKVVARAYGITPRYTYGAALLGFAATISQNQRVLLLTDRRVAYVAHDGPLGLVDVPGPPPAGPPGAPPAGPQGPPLAPAPDPNAPLPGAGAGAGAPEAEKPGAQAAAGGAAGDVVPWGIARIGASKNPNDGAGAHVYVIDTGIDADHEDLIGNLGMGFAAIPCQGKCSQPWDDDHFHGTHVSGTIAARSDGKGVVGVAPRATLHAVKVLDSTGFGSYSSIVAGIDWVMLDARSRFAPAVANMSLGGGGFKTGTCTAGGYVGFDPMHEAICNAKNQGVVFAVAAGNSGSDARFFVPAAYDDAVITVSATQQGDDWAGFSNWGNQPGTGLPTNSDPVVLAAPGVGVLSCYPGGFYAFLSGTSMASPHVAGAIALYMARHFLFPDPSAYTTVRKALLDASEATNRFANTSGHAHSERFLDASKL